MTKHTHSLLLGLSIFLILGCFAVNADPPTPEVSDIEYKSYADFPIDPEGRKYHRFLQFPAPQGASYDTQKKATANIDDTPEKETIVLMVARAGEEWSDWCQAFLLIAEDETQEVGLPKKKVLFKLFDAGVYDFDVPGKTIEVRNPPFVFDGLWRGGSWRFRRVSFKLVDLTGDGILDIWVDHAYGVAVISFQNGEFKEIFSSYTVPGALPDVEYVDLDNDGTYEIKIPYSIYIEELPGVPHLPWMSLYEWNGNDYVLNNERFYAENNDFLIRILGEYNYQMLQRGGFVNYCETYRFYLGLLYYYQGSKSPSDLEWILEHAKNNDYIQAASALLKKLPPH